MTAGNEDWSDLISHLHMIAEPIQAIVGLDELTRGWNFEPYRALRNQHAMTIIASLLPRRYTIENLPTESRLFEVEPGVSVLAHCNWQSDPSRCATIIIVHGLEGSSRSRYALGTADKAYRAGFNTVRLNLRNCGGTEHLTPTLYNAGQSGDLAIIARQLAETDGLERIYFAGFSLGGNQVLKLAGEYGENPPPHVRGIVAISPSIDLTVCIEDILRPSNRLYHWKFLRGLKNRLRRKAALYPDRYDLKPLEGIKTIREFDDIYTSRDGGYSSVDDYYTRASAGPLLNAIRIPSIIIHASDDPFITHTVYPKYLAEEQRYVSLYLTRSGGHVGFIGSQSGDYDRFWLEHRIVDFIKYLERSIGGVYLPSS